VDEQTESLSRPLIARIEEAFHQYRFSMKFQDTVLEEEFVKEYFHKDF
jgi:hypothetical protein